MENRKRNIQMKFYVTEEEKRLIDEKMKQLPIKQYGAYLRKMAIDGYILVIDRSDTKAYIRELQAVSRNINQIAKRANAMGAVYKQDIEDIKKMCRDDIVKAKKLMAFEVTKLVHGEEEARKVQQASEDLFSKHSNDVENMPNIDVKLHGSEQNIVDILFKINLGSKSEIRRLISQKGIEIDARKIDADFQLDKSLHEFIVKKGKKTFIKVNIID